MAERESNGQFAKGNKGGPGRPRRQTEREYLSALRDSVSSEDWMEIVKKAVEQAKNGDARSRQWLTGYLISTQPDRMLETLAVEEELGIDPIEKRIEERKQNEELFGDLFSLYRPEKKANGRSN